jgi:hypothetical protein
MTLLSNPRAIIARKSLMESLDRLVEAGGDPARPELRSTALQQLKGALASGEAELLRRLGSGENGISYGLARSYLV